jgi:N-acetyl-anhydromuramyl-L-alanine amidase AmpD
MTNLTLSTIPFEQAKYFTAGRSSGPIKQVTLHTPECQELPGQAHQIANEENRGMSQASVHYSVDNGAIWQEVKLKDTAWATGVWAQNQISINIEIAGKASQTPSQWQDAYSVATLNKAAELVALFCHLENIPIVHLTPAQTKAGAAGINGHKDVTAAYAIAGGHTDPGTNFPWGTFLTLVTAASKLIVG